MPPPFVDTTPVPGDLRSAREIFSAKTNCPGTGEESWHATCVTESLAGFQHCARTAFSSVSKGAEQMTQIRKQSVDLDQLISLRDVAQLAGLHERSCAIYSMAGVLPSVKIGHARLFLRAEVEEWISKRATRRRRTNQTAFLAPQSETGA